MGKSDVLGFLSTEILNSAISKLEMSGSLDAPVGDIALRQAVAACVPKLARMPELGERSFSADSILISNAPEELIFSLVTCFGNLQRGVLVDAGARSAGETYGQILNRPVDRVMRDAEMGFDAEAFLAKAREVNPAIIFLSNPGDPCGDLVSPRFIKQLLTEFDSIVVVDETMAEFSNRTLLGLEGEFENLCIIRSLTYARPVADFQIAYGVASESVAAKVRGDLTYHTVDAITQAIGVEICENATKFDAYISSTFARRLYMSERLKCLMGCTVYPSSADFILVKIGDAVRAKQIMANEYAISLDDISDACDPKRFLKIPIGSDDENSRMLEALADCLMQGC